MCTAAAAFLFRGLCVALLEPRRKSVEVLCYTSRAAKKIQGCKFFRLRVKKTSAFQLLLIFDGRWEPCVCLPFPLTGPSCVFWAARTILYCLSSRTFVFGMEADYQRHYSNHQQRKRGQLLIFANYRPYSHALHIIQRFKHFSQIIDQTVPGLTGKWNST